MTKHQKVAAIVWTTDPEDNKRYLLRHNRPFKGYEDEWTVAFGDIEANENIKNAAKREISEEFGIRKFKRVKNLDYKVEFNGKHGPTEAHFVALEVIDLNIKIVLNEESIGYDWMLLEKVKEVMSHEDEKKAFELVE